MKSKRADAPDACKQKTRFEWRVFFGEKIICPQLNPTLLVQLQYVVPDHVDLFGNSLIRRVYSEFRQVSSWCPIRGTQQTS
jgi:hypothetical protein